MNNKHSGAGEMILGADEVLTLIKAAFDSNSPFVLTVTGYSMRPTLNHCGDKVELKDVKDTQVKKGDIVFFRRESAECVLHRVINIDHDELVVNGDAQLWTERVSVDRIVGVVSRINRNGKWISCDSISYRMYTAIWMALKPVRGFVIRVKNLLLRKR